MLSYSCLTPIHRENLPCILRWHHHLVWNTCWTHPKCLQALEDAKLYCNPKKTKLFCSEVHFLGHWILTWGIEPNEGKADHIRNWPIPKNVSNVCSFLGLVCYLSAFLPKLANYTMIWTDSKGMWQEFYWMEIMPSIKTMKKLVTFSDCLTAIDPHLMPDSKIFVTTNASNTRSGVILFFSPSYNTTHPITYNSQSFKGAKLNYPVHEKELLATIWALAKRNTDLLGYCFEIWTNHKTLEHFESQCDLSRQQAC